MKEGLKKELRAFMVGMFGLTLIVLCSGIFSAVSHADSTQQYNKIFLQPFYRETLSSSTNYTYTLNINPPDNIQNVLNAIITIHAQINGQSQNMTLRINNQSCNNPSYYIATAFSTTGENNFFFDCSNRIQKSGTYNITINSAVNTGVISAWLDLTYMNNPNGQVKYVGGTDYYMGEMATVFLQLQDASGAAVNNASCNFDIYNTSNPLVTPIYNKQPMVFRGADGIYYYQFPTIGLPTGVYPLDAECTYIYDNYYFYTGISPTINVTTNSGTLLGGSPFALNSGNDADYMQWNSVPNVTLRWDNVVSNITQLDFIFTMATSGSRTFSFYARNKTSGAFNFIGSVVASGNGVNQPDLFTSRISLDYLNSTNQVSIQVVQTAGGGSTNVYFDWATLKAYKNSTYITEVKGSSEVHIYPLNISDMPQLVWNYTTRTLTDYNMTGLSANQSNIIANQVVMNNTLNQVNGTANNIYSYLTTMIYPLLTSMNSTIGSMQGTLNTVANNVLTILGLTQQINTTVNSINFTPTIIINTTNTTNIYNNTEIFNYTQNVTFIVNQTNTTIENNNTQIFNYTQNVTVTPVFNVTTQNVTVQNVTVVVNTTNLTFDYETQASYVWNSTQRMLTDYNLTEIYNIILNTNSTVNWINQSLVPNTIYIW
jgi:hypothetical protein